MLKQVTKNINLSKVCRRGVRGSVAAIFLKFITEPIEIGFLIIRTDAHRLGSVFRPIAVRFFRLV